VWFRVCAGPVQFEPGDDQHGGEMEQEHGSATHGAGHGAAAAHGGRGGAAHGGGAFHPHAPGFAINLVLVLITAGAVASIFARGWAGSMVAHSSAVAGMPAHHDAADFADDPHQWMMLVAVLVSLGGIGMAWYLHLAKRGAAESLKNAMLARRAIGWLPRAMENKWYVDELFHLTLVGPAWILGHVLHAFDRYVIDFVLVDGTARLPRALGRAFQPLQNGVLQSYAVSMAGLAGLIALLVLFMPELIEWLGSLGGAAAAAGGPG
jgi:NADH:ubiquinone oxidoreductase subunit 5 (subunit L)/multisubunit Na+/H+ antiporter MnhA subunit